jgi:ABC-type multidrug transport system permease subunit
LFFQLESNFENLTVQHWSSMFLWLLSWVGLAGQIAFAVFSLGMLCISYTNKQAFYEYEGCM